MIDILKDFSSCCVSSGFKLVGEKWKEGVRIGSMVFDFFFLLQFTLRCKFSTCEMWMSVSGVYVTEKKIHEMVLDFIPGQEWWHFEVILLSFFGSVLFFKFYSCSTILISQPTSRLWSYPGLLVELTGVDVKLDMGSKKNGSIKVDPQMYALQWNLTE